MNKSNFAMVLSGFLIAISAVYYSQAAPMVVNYYAVTPFGCQPYSYTGGCTTAVTSQLCTVYLSQYAANCNIRKENSSTNPPSSCAIPMYRPN